MAEHKIDLRKIKHGRKVLVDIIDELPDGDGSSIYNGILTVDSRKGEFVYFVDSDLIGRLSEIKEIYPKK